ncbi:MAG: hypothetical protein AVDCRST_MAG40-3514, partial [uncultured Gemmatimonadaceae bacterium]
ALQNLPRHQHHRVRSGLRHLDARHGLVGREDGRRGGGDAPALARRARRHLLRRGRHVRQRALGAAARRGVPRAALRGGVRHQGGLRHLRRGRGGRAARAERAAAARGRVVPAHGGGPLPRAPRDRLRGRAAAPQREDGARARPRRVGDAARAQGRGEDPRLGRRLRAGDRLALRGGGAVRARARREHDPDDLERARAAPGHGDDRGGRAPRARLLLQHPRHARLGDARGEVHRGHGVREQRPPAPPAALVAGERAAEDPHARLPHRSDDARPGGAQVAARRAAGGDDAAQHLRRRAARRVRRGQRPPRPHPRAARARGGAGGDQLRRRRAGDDLQGNDDERAGRGM